MTNPIRISQKEARQLTLSCQGLDDPYHNSLQAIQQINYVQIDTISVTERAHNHVIFTRNPAFKANELIQLMDDKSIFEYWSHAAAYLPIEDYRYSLFTKEQYKNGGKHWFPRDKKVDQYVLDRIRIDGPLQSKDFESPKTINHDWYTWKPAKISLGNLFMDGSLMIANRIGFQKVFDMTERVLPDSVDATTPTENEYCQHLVDKAIKAHGLVTLDEIAYLRKGIKPALKKIVTELLESKAITSLHVHGNDNTYYTTNATLNVLNHDEKKADEIHILNPFDNLLIQRKRVKELFDFDYQIECYVPEKKRVFGYYTLAVLFGDAFVARFDAKADRKTGAFTIKGLWYEKGFKQNKRFHNAFHKKLSEFALFCGCTSIINGPKLSPRKSNLMT